MNEIAQLLQEKAGLSPDQSQEVAKAIVSLIQSKVPSEFQGVHGSVLGADGGGQTAEAGGLGGLLGAAEGLFGSKG